MLIPALLLTLHASSSPAIGAASPLAIAVASRMPVPASAAGRQAGAPSGAVVPSRPLAGGATHVIRIDVDAADQIVRGAVEQLGSDVAVTVHDPGDRQIAFYDAQQRGTEHVVFVAAVPGVYRLDIRSLDAAGQSGAIRARFDLPRARRDDDTTFEEAVARSTEARQLFKKGERDGLRDSLAVRASALSLWQSLGDTEMVQSTYAGIGDVNYRLSDYAAARTAYAEALPIARLRRDGEMEGELTNNLAMCRWRLGEVAEGREGLEQALAIWHRLGSPEEAKALSNLGILQRQSGEYDEARRSYARALAIHRRTGNRRSAAFALNNLAIVLDALGRRDEALQQLARAMTLFAEFKERRAEGRALLATANIQLAKGRSAAALEAVTRGLPLIRAAGDRRSEAEAMEHRGRILLARGDPAAAREQLTQALAIYRELRSPRGESDALHGLGLSWLAAGDGARALGFFDSALRVRRAIGVSSLVADTLAHGAQAARLTGDLTRARADAEAAIQLAERMRAGVFEHELRTSYSAAMHRYYTDYIATLAAAHRATPDGGFDAQAFVVADRVKARSALERLRESRVVVARAVDPALVRRERQLRGLLAYWAWQLWEQADQPGGGSAAATRIRATVDTLSAEHDEVEGEIRRLDSRRTELWHPEDVSLRQIQQDVLTPETVLLAFSLGEPRSHVWAVTRDRLTLQELPGRASVERQARRLLATVDHHVPGDDGAAARAAASALSRMLLAPVAAQLDRRRIVIVADGVLHAVPFGLLPKPGRGTPLVESHDLATAPSVAILRWLTADAATRRRAGQVLAALGDPVFAPDDVRVPQAAPTQNGGAPLSRRVSRLPYTRDEVERIIALAPESRRLRAVDFEASRALMLSGALRDYRYVHLATHAERNDRHPGLSGIILSLVGPDGSPQDGFLRLQDIYGLRLRADLVVLSACDTAVGREMAGEGLQSLAQGFFHAGASRVLASTWKVDDEATTELMVRFYQQLLTGRMSPAAALRRAQRDLRQQARWAHPYFWSGWILQGGS